MKKRLLSMILAAVMVVGMTFTSFAFPNGVNFVLGDRTIRTGSNEAGVFRYACGGPSSEHWKWVNGYCYYFTDPSGQTKLTSCTTPDGYTVDADGKWVVNGVPQFDGYGSQVIGTDALYAGKDDNGRWIAIRTELEKLYAETSCVDGTADSGVAMMSYENSVYSTSAHPADFIVHNGNGNYLDIQITSIWDDAAPHANKENESRERLFKILMGDHVGQEFFNAVRAAADPAVAGGTALKYDANGNPIPTKVPYTAFDGSIVYLDGFETVQTATQSDGINWDLFNFAAWQGRKTDYGKTMSFDVIKTGSGPQWYKLHISVK